VQDLNCGQMSVSGCKGDYKFILGARSKAKTVTTASAGASAEAEQLTHIVRVMFRLYYVIMLKI